MSHFRNRLDKSSLPATDRGLIYPTGAMRLTHYLYQCVCQVFFHIYCPLQVYGRNRLPKPPFVLCSNHCSHLDSPVLILASGLAFDRVGMVAAQDYFFAGSARRNWLCWLMNLLPASRAASRDGMLRLLVLCREFVGHRQRSLIIYPEGTRSRDGQIGQMRRGAAMIAIELGLPVVPVWIHGTYRSLPKGACVPRPRRLVACLGDSITPPDRSQGSVTRACAELTEQLQQRICALRDVYVGQERT